MEKDFYSVRCIFKHENLNNDSKPVYEERITLWQASSFEEAVIMAENEAGSYARDIGCLYTGLSQAFHFLKNEITSGVEVFSLMRESDKSTKDYLDSFFDTGNEKQRNLYT
ncbi:MAG: DUF4288 domain-containing protein [Desulfobacteraceae bacterium]|jgi:hypothetical protein